MLRNKSLFDMDMIFDRFPREVFPFDFETYFSSSIQCQLVVTNCITGKSGIHGGKERQRASSGDRKSFQQYAFGEPDGICGRSAVSGRRNFRFHSDHPFFEDRASEKCDRTDKKLRIPEEDQSHTKELYLAAYRKYPNLARATDQPRRVYNRTLDLIEKWELQGRVYVIRPQIPPVSRVEQNYEVLTNFYQHGYDRMKEQVR